MLKRAFDIVIALFLVVLSAPLALAIALVMKMERPGPIIHASQRMGRLGKPFSYYRFRTRVGTPSIYTRFGKFIGNLSLDEIPGFWNVLKGDLSLVGPRPELPVEVDLNDPDWQKVLSVRPGLTGLGLLTFMDKYNQTSVKERIQPEIRYVEHRSFLMDVRILAKTVYLLTRMGHLKGRL
jgi:lipopolysaccharide/colanic/teichoic acid biosynthesis glycosyltransferase